MPSTLEGKPPVAAYNLGWQEGRDSVTSRTGEPEPDVAGWDQDAEPEGRDDIATQAELPFEYRATQAYLDGYAKGFHEGRHGRHW